MPTDDDTGKDATFTAMSTARALETISNPHSWGYYPYLGLVRPEAHRDIQRHSVGTLLYVSFDLYYWYPGVNMHEYSGSALRNLTVQALQLDTVAAQSLLSEGWVIQHG